MTRLVEEDIEQVVIRMNQYDKELEHQVGRSLVEVAMHAMGVQKRIKDYKTAVIPVTSGLGIIDGFSDTVCGILRYCGIDTFVTEGTDVAGLQEAYQKGAEMFFMADDNICSAFSLLGNHIYSDNGYATGTGFAAALELAMLKNEGMDSIQNMEALVLGAGPVGTAATKYLSEHDITVKVLDVIPEKAETAVKNLAHATILERGRKKKEFRYILDGTPVARVLTGEDVNEQTVVAAPGMPLGITKEGQKKACVIFNPLELGIICMYFDCMKQLEG